MSGRTAYIGGCTCSSNRRCAYFAPGIPWEIFIAVSVNYILYTTVPTSREPLVWVVDIDFDICTSCSSAIFIARIKRQTSFTELPDFHIVLVANIVPVKNLKLRSHPTKPIYINSRNIFMGLIKNTRKDTLYMYKYCKTKENKL